MHMKLLRMITSMALLAPDPISLVTFSTGGPLPNVRHIYPALEPSAPFAPNVQGLQPASQNTTVSLDLLQETHDAQVTRTMVTQDDPELAMNQDRANPYVEAMAKMLAATMHLATSDLC